MSDTYCGKSCDECVYRAQLKCVGCKEGPGRPMYGDCELAKCCKEKGHKACDTCIYSGNCGTLRRRASIPKERIRDAAAELERKAELARKAPILGKWMWLLFLLVIPGVAASLMTQENIVAWIPALNLPGQVLNVLVMVAYGIILLKMSPENENYKISGICWLAVSVGNVIVALFAGGGEAWTLILTIPVAIVSVAGEYLEYTGHAEVLESVDYALSEKWKRLSKWYIGTFVTMFGSIILVVILQIIGLLIMLAAAIALVVVKVLKVVYLYQSAKTMRGYAEV